MSHKLKSRKLWVLLIMTIVMITLTYTGHVTSDDLTQFLTWSYGIYATGNIASKLKTV